ncbi:MAG TPA: 2OG-Fe dioxygenase family protein [Steroidobacteraceae bacterium]
MFPNAIPALSADHRSSHDAAKVLRETGFVLVSPASLERVSGLSRTALDSWRETWNRLPRDQYLLDGGRYRFRRHSCFIQHLEGSRSLERAPHRAHWQPTHYNALHGGIERWFEPIEDEVLDAPAWEQLLVSLGDVFSILSPVDRWYIEAHQFRIDAAEGIGRPTPEGAHRDGVDYVAVILVDRQGVRGGETRVFEADGVCGVRFTMQEPWTMLLLDDARVVHETTPIQKSGERPLRDTLVLTYRAGGFQEPERG